MHIGPTHEVQENIFGFAEPNHLNCWVEAYSRSHSVFVIAIHALRSEEFWHAEFSATRYVSHFNIIASWMGANFELLPIEESLRMAQILGFPQPTEAEAEVYTDSVENLISKACKVYRIRPLDDPNKQIVICASKVILHDRGSILKQQRHFQPPAEG